MNKIVATPIMSIDSMSLTDDRLHVLLAVGVKEGQATLALPHALLRPLLTLVSTGLGQIEAESLDGAARAVFIPREWQIKQAVDGSVVFCFRLKGEAELSFQIGQQDISRFKEILDSIVLSDLSRRRH